MTKRKVANPLALAVLACLFERPMHPYEMASTMRERHKDDSIKLNYGSLYSVVEALLRQRLIEAGETERKGNRPERTVYRLTDAGRLELIDWLSELLSRPVKEYTQFEAGLSLLPVLAPNDARALLEERCHRLEVDIAQSRAAREHAGKRKVPRLFLIEAEYREAMRAAELKWTRALVSEIVAGSLEGLLDWEAWHREGRRPNGQVAPAPDDA